MTKPKKKPPLHNQALFEGLRSEYQYRIRTSPEDRPKYEALLRELEEKERLTRRIEKPKAFRQPRHDVTPARTQLMLAKLWAAYKATPIDYTDDGSLIVLRASDFGLGIGDASKLRYSAPPHPQWLKTSTIRNPETGKHIRVHVFKRP